jgi:hypothetical protein
MYVYMYVCMYVHASTRRDRGVGVGSLRLAGPLALLPRHTGACVRVCVCTYVQLHTHTHVRGDKKVKLAWHVVDGWRWVGHIPPSSRVCVRVRVYVRVCVCTARLQRCGRTVSMHLFEGGSLRWPTGGDWRYVPQSTTPSSRGRKDPKAAASRTRRSSSRRLFHTSIVVVPPHGLAHHRNGR